MRHLLFLAALLCAISAAGAASAHGFCPLPRCAPQSAGPQPVYVIRYVHGGGYPVCAPATGYAYGWFGVPRRRHRSTHYGHYNNFTQHSHR